jgi:hypothetical protein
MSSTPSSAKLAGILELLASYNPGEVAAAAAAATRFLRSRGIRRCDILLPDALPPPAGLASSLLDNWPARWRAAAHAAGGAR